MVDAEQILDRAEEQRQQKQELLRPVAEFFHRHEGELFERYDAVDELIEDEHIPSDNERRLHQVVGNLAADRVDPVQNVVRDSGKYVGVVEYDEHDYWYEYVEVDDVRGRQNIGVCAQCVTDAENDAQVAKGIGTTEELADRIADHYDEEHSESPESVETGATLVSGTTIAGNDAIHSANDGVGSGLDADTVRGTEESNLVRSGINYLISEPSGIVQDQFASPCHGPRGVGIDSNSCIWHAGDSVEIYKLNQSGGIQSNINVPGNAPIGIDVDSNDCVWNSDGGGDSIFKLNQNGNVQTQFNSPCFSSRGVGVDSNDCIWNADDQMSIYKINHSGTIQTQFATPCSRPQGVGVDSNDCLWQADEFQQSIYELNQSGTENSRFKSPSSGASGVGVDSYDYIWHADFDAQSIYKILPKAVKFQ